MVGGRGRDHDNPGWPKANVNAERELSLIHALSIHGQKHFLDLIYPCFIVDEIVRLTRTRRVWRKGDRRRRGTLL